MDRDRGTEAVDDKVDAQSPATILVDGSATAYRLYDIGYAIDLDPVADLLGEAMRGRSRPARNEAQTFQIRNPPLFASLGERMVTIANEPRAARLSAHLFDFGVCSLRLTVVAPAGSTWSSYAELGTAFDASDDLARTFDAELVRLLDLIKSAVQRPEVAPVTEDYVVFRIHGLAADNGQPLSHEVLTDDHLVPLLLGEHRRLSSQARRELLSNRFAYYENDLAVLTWDNALVFEPRRDDEDVELLLEFANAQLLELRLYDAQLDAELPALYERIAAARRRRWAILRRRFSGLLTEMQTRVADITEIVERADNAFKVTDDVYLARLYAATLEMFRERAWRRGIDRKLQIFRDTYSMLNAETQIARAEFMELIIVLLIGAELVLGLMQSR